MAERRSLASTIIQVLISIAIAAALLTATTLARVALAPQLGALSPFMLYVAGVLLAGLVRGPFCGSLVLLGGGLIGFRLFLAPEGVPHHGAVVALMIFWGVSAPVLVTANELRVQVGRAMARLSAALDRGGRTAT